MVSKSYLQHQPGPQAPTTTNPNLVDLSPCLSHRCLKLSPSPSCTDFWSSPWSLHFCFPGGDAIWPVSGAHLWLWAVSHLPALVSLRLSCFSFLRLCLIWFFPPVAISLLSISIHPTWPSALPLACYLLLVSLYYCRYLRLLPKRYLKDQLTFSIENFYW